MYRLDFNTNGTKSLVLVLLNFNWIVQTNSISVLSSWHSVDLWSCYSQTLFYVFEFCAQQMSDLLPVYWWNQPQRQQKTSQLNLKQIQSKRLRKKRLVCDTMTALTQLTSEHSQRRFVNDVTLKDVLKGSIRFDKLPPTSLSFNCICTSCKAQSHCEFFWLDNPNPMARIVTEIILCWLCSLPVNDVLWNRPGRKYSDNHDAYNRTKVMLALQNSFIKVISHVMRPTECKQGGKRFWIGIYKDHNKV